jgi:hypothetical protein
VKDRDDRDLIRPAREALDPERDTEADEKSCARTLARNAIDVSGTGRSCAHPALEHPPIHDAVMLILDQLAKPIADTWGCTHAGHLVTIVERLGRVSTEIQNVTDHKGAPSIERTCREDLLKQLAELGMNVLVMIAEELEAISR